jgi:hypothetical protein
MPVSTTPSYRVGLLSLSKDPVGLSVVTPDTLYLFTGAAEDILHIPHTLFSRDAADKSLVKISITDTVVRDLLQSIDSLCIYNGQIDTDALNPTATSRIFLSREGNTIDIIHNTPGSAWSVTSGHLWSDSEFELTSMPGDVILSPCDKSVGDDRDYQIGDVIIDEQISAGSGVPSRGSYTTQTTNKATIHSNNSSLLTPGHIGYTLPVSGNDSLSQGVSFLRSPLGKAFSKTPGGPATDSGFSVSFTSSTVSDIQIAGPNSVPSFTAQGIHVYIPRYKGMPITAYLRNGAEIPMVQTGFLPEYILSLSDPMEITDGDHTLSVHLVKGEHGQHLYVYAEDQLIARTRKDIIPVFSAQSVVFHFHDNGAGATETISNIRYKRHQILLDRLTPKINEDKDCPLSVVTYSNIRSLTTIAGIPHLLLGLEPYTKVGYLHLTIANPTTNKVNISIHVTDDPHPGGTPLHDLTLDPLENIEIPQVRLQEAEKCFVQSSQDGIVARAFSIEEKTT